MTHLWGCKTVHGTRKMHSILGYDVQNPCNVKIRDFSCFCEACMNCHYDQCENSDRVGAWKPVLLEPLPNAEVPEPDPDLLVEAMAFGEGDDADLLAECVEVGDHFAVRAEDENGKARDFFILKCTKVKYTVEQTVLDPWNEGQSWEPGFTLMEGTYYFQYSKSPKLYVLLDDKPDGIVEAHLVRYLKFPMELTGRLLGTGGKAIYRLPDMAYDACLQACEQWADFDGTSACASVDCAD